MMMAQSKVRIEEVRDGLILHISLKYSHNRTVQITDKWDGGYERKWFQIMTSRILA